MEVNNLLSSMDTWDFIVLILFISTGLYALVNYIIVLIKDKNREIKVKASRYYLMVSLLFFLLSMLTLKR